MAVVEDIWLASRKRLTLSDVIARHGFHGPLEGDVAARVWREDAEPLRRMIARYEQCSERDSRRCLERQSVERGLVIASPVPWRPFIRLLLRFTRNRLPLRGVAKRSM